VAEVNELHGAWRKGWSRQAEVD